MRGDILLAQAMGEIFFAKESVVQNLSAFLNKGMQIEQKIPNTSNQSVTMQKIENIAIINIDGAMYKKDMSGFCMSVASYQAIEAYTNEAIAMYKKGEIKELGYRVSTPGGGVYGLDSVERMISKLEMPTFTYYEDIGCSAGIYAFTASKELYAAPMTELGSIGVVVQLVKDKKQKVITVTSSRASNKRLDLETKEGQDKLRKELDIYEERFYNVVMKNTGFSAEKIQKEFDNGGTIMSDKAQEIGFIDEVIGFEELIDRKLNMGGSNTAKTDVSASAPTAEGDKVAQNSNTGANMEFNQENFNILLESRTHLNSNIANLNAQLEESTSTLEATREELAEANAQLEGASARQEDMETRMREAIAVGADADTAVEMLNAKDGADASKIANDFRGSEGATSGADLQDDAATEAKEKEELEYAKNVARSLSIKKG